MLPRAPTTQRESPFAKRFDLKLTTEISPSMISEFWTPRQKIDDEHTLLQRGPKTCRQQSSRRKAYQDLFESKTPSINSKGHYLRTAKSAGQPLRQSQTAMLAPLQSRVFTVPPSAPGENLIPSDPPANYSPGIADSSPTYYPAQLRVPQPPSDSKVTPPRTAPARSFKLKLHDGIPSFYFTSPRMSRAPEGPVISTDGAQTDVFVPDPLDPNKVESVFTRISYAHHSKSFSPQHE